MTNEGNQTFPEQYDIQEKATAAKNGTETKEKTGKQDTPASEYKPAEATIKKLDDLPWEEIKQELGIDKQQLIRQCHHYGPLEAFAYGRFGEPMQLHISAGHQKPIDKFGTIRLYTYKNREGEKTWGYEIHPVILRPKRDADGNIVMNGDKEAMEVYCNPLTATRDKDGNIVEEKLVYNRRELSQEQVRHLRLTGNLGEPLRTKGFDGQDMDILLSVDRYNNHHLIAANCAVIRARYSAHPVVQLKGGDTVQLTEKQVNGIADGESIWVETKKGSKICIQYDCHEARVRPATDYDYALRKEQQESVKEKASRTQDQSQAQAVSLKRGPQR